MIIVEWIQVSTQIITAVTALVMAYFTCQTYLKAPEQETAFNEEVIGHVSEVLVFKTSKQTIWLCVSSQGLECRIDDVREGKGGPQWILPRTKVIQILLSNSYV